MAAVIAMRPVAIVGKMATMAGIVALTVSIAASSGRVAKSAEVVEAGSVVEVLLCADIVARSDSLAESGKEVRLEQVREGVPSQRFIINCRRPMP